MNDRRHDRAPAFLFALAAGAATASVMVTLSAKKPAPSAPLREPKRVSAPLVWPLADLPALAPTLAGVRLVEDFAATDQLVITVPPPFDAAPGSWVWDDADTLATAPLASPAENAIRRETSAPKPKVDATPFRGRMTLLVPASPTVTAGAPGRLVVSPRMRRRWEIAGVDGLAAIRVAGRRFASGLVLGDAEEAAAAAAAGVQWLVASIDAIDIRPEKEPPVAAAAPTGPALTAPAPAPMVIVAPMVAIAPPAEARRAVAIPTIAAYLGSASPAGRGLPAAHSLGAQLDRVAGNPELSPWAWAAAYRLRTLASTSAAEGMTVQRNLEALAAAASEGLVTADQIASPAEATELRRAAYALDRRVAVWRSSIAYAESLARREADALEDIRWAMTPGGQGLPSLAARTDAHRIAQRLERYESAPDGPTARFVADAAQELAESPVTEDRLLAQSINANYRNANVRVAVAAGLIERLLPQPEPETAPVRDRIAGAPVSGRATTHSRLTVRLTPDDEAWRVGLEAHGSVSAQTLSKGGPARLATRGETAFHARKLVVLSGDELRSAPAVATATATRTRLVGLRTEYDSMPIVADFVRSSALDEYARRRPRARRQTAARVEQRVRQALDERVADQLAVLGQRFDSEVAERVDRLGMAIEPIELRTTDSRLIGRVRLAGERQLAAHTPRMRAPSDSLVSVQVHESLLNNAIEGLDLAGARLTPNELRDRLQVKLGLPPRDGESDDRAVLQFADVDPARLRLEGGHAELMLSFAELAVGRRRHRDFKVYTTYRPVVSGLTAELAQDGTPEIEGRLRTASRLHLHGVLGKVLREDFRIPLVRLHDETPERVLRAMSGLATNQFVIEDGWLGLAIGPERRVGRVAIAVGGYVR